MADLNRQLLDLFQSSHGLLLPDETALQEISMRQGALKVWNKEIVLQGLITMGEFLQDLADQNKVHPDTAAGRHRDLVRLWTDGR
jgi:hypothetical protein